MDFLPKILYVPRNRGAVAVDLPHPIKRKRLKGYGYMAKAPKTAISPTRQEDYPEWYQQVIIAAELAENSPVRGCMVIKPWGYAIWENIQRELDRMFKETGHKNAYFPLFIPKSFLEKEAEHVEGFAKECAVVTHHRLEAGPDGGLVPAGELEEPLVVRPTSETIIGAMFAKWVQSYRDLPLLINQWANVVRWEMRTRLFLRTTEFLWQEGHTVHETREDAWEETMRMLEVYADFAENFGAIPVIRGEKSPGERFPGALNTFCIEAMMQDRKALQSGTTHYLGENFARASNIQFSSRSGELQYAHTTSWGVSTRIVGALIMCHSDDDGLVLPPRLAPIQVVILPVIREESQEKEVMEYCRRLESEIARQQFHGNPIAVEVDTSEKRGGEKTWGWIKKGVPIRLEIGMREVKDDQVFFGRRDQSPKAKRAVPREEFNFTIPQILAEIQQNLFDRAGEFRREHTLRFDDRDKFIKYFTPKNAEKPEIHGGFALAHWCGTAECEAWPTENLKVTIRCIPLDAEEEAGKCIFCGGESNKRVVFAKSY
jgi:prolyl-tRNA synthetase